MADAFPISGNIDPKAFPFLLMDLHRNGATGSLKVEGPTYQKALYFRGGRILFGSSNDPRDQLGAILIESGKLTPEQLEDVNSKVGPGNPLAKALADSGFVSQRELGEAARAKVERILSDVIVYESGSFEFEDGVLPKGAVDLKLSTERVVLASVRRVTDRNFVLRHLESLEVVLQPTSLLAAGLTELQAEGGGLPERLDGRQTLKEAAGLTQLDDFEAAKVACALLFLGMVQRGEGGAGGGELDLSQTARMAFDEPATVMMPTQFPEPEPEPSPGPRMELPTVIMPEPEPAFVLPDASPPAFGMEAESAPVFEPPPPPEPEPEPEMSISPAPEPVPQRDVSRRKPLPLVPPPPRAMPQPEEVVVPVPAPPSSRPSKEDLAALDELLNARSLEGPLAPLEKPAPTEERWEPRFGQPAPGRGGARSRRMSPLVVGGAAVIVLALAGGAWLYLTQASTAPSGAARPSAARAATGAPSAAPSPAPGSPATSDASSPSPGAAAVPPSAAAPSPVAPTAAALPSPARTAAASAPPTARPPTSAPIAAASDTPGGGLGDARSLLQQGRLDEAARGFVTNIKKASGGSFSIQILVACSGETVQKAVENVPAPELYILPVNYKGRDCYRLCWGLYESQARADSALGSVPDYFRKGGAAPRVVPASGLMP